MQVRRDGQRAVVGQQQRVVGPDGDRDDVGVGLGGGRAVGQRRHAAQAVDHLRNHVAGDRVARQGQCDGDGGVRVDHRANVGPLAVRHGVHPDFGRGQQPDTLRLWQDAAFEVCPHQLLGAHVALAQAARRHQQPVPQPHGDVAIRAGDVVLLPQPASHLTDMLADTVFV